MLNNSKSPIATPGAPAQTGPDDVIPGGLGEMARRFANHDWAATALGPRETWPVSLTAAARLILGSRYPMFIWWGPEFTNLYNDAYAPILGKRHPKAFGRPAREAWSDIWSIVGPLAQGVVRTGEAVWHEELLLVMERHGYAEETYFTFSYSPAADDDGRVQGIFCTCTEETSRVLTTRRLRTLRELTAQTRGARSAEAACIAAANAAAADAHDIPFALIYLLSPNGEAAVRVATAGVASDAVVAPKTIPLRGKARARPSWPLAQVLEEKRPLLVSPLPDGIGQLAGSPWPELPHSAKILPIAPRAGSDLTGFLVLGISPRRIYDDDYRGFFELIAGQLGTAIADARAYDAELKRAEAMAQIDRTQLDATLHSADIGTWSWDVAENRLVTDKKLAQLFSVRQVDGGAPIESFLDAIHPEDRPRVESKITETLEQLSEIEDDYRIVQPNGPPRWVTVRGKAYPGADGTAQRLTGVLIDVTARKMKEELRRRSDAQIAAIIDRAPVGIYLLDEDLRLQQVNPRARPVFGSVVENLIGSSIVEVLHRMWPEPQAAALIAKFRHTLETGESHYEPGFSEERRDRDQREFYDWELHRLVLPDGRHGLVCYFTDISGHVAAQRKIRESAEQLRLALSAAKLGDWNWDVSTDAVILSERAAEIFGLAPGSATTWGELRALLHAADAEMAAAAVDEAVRTGSDYDVEYRVRLPEGNWRWVAAKGGVRFAGNGAIAGMLGVVQDITAEKRAEEERAALLTAEREAREEAEALSEAARLFASELDLQATVQQATDAGTRLTGAKFGAFFYNVVDERQESYVLYTLSGAPREAFERFGLPRNTAVFAPTFNGEGVVRVRDITADERYGRNAPHRGMPKGHLPVRSYLAVPVIARNGQVLGGMFFGHPEPDVFTARSERIAVGIAAQAAIAMDNAKLYEAARRSAERLNFSLSAMKLGIWTWDATSDAMTISPRTAEIYGFPPDRPITREEMRVALHPEDRDRARKAAGDAVNTRSDYDIEYRVSHPTRGLRWVAVKGRCMFTEQGAVQGMMGVVQDVTERKHAELQLQTQKEVLERIVSGLSLGETLERLTEGVEAIVDRPLLTAILLRQPDAQTLRPIAGKNLPEAWRRALDPLPIGPLGGACGAVAASGERTITTDVETDPRWATLREVALANGIRAGWSTPIVSSDGAVLGTFAIYHGYPAAPTPQELEIVDVAVRTAAIAIERKQSEQALRDYQAQLEEHAQMLEKRVAERTARLRETIGELEAFSYSVSHDMRAPLRAMQGYADAVLKDYGPKLDAEGVHALTRIGRNAERLELLVRDILAYSKVAKEEIELRPVPLDPLLANLLMHMPPLQPPAAQVRVPEPLPVVIGHEAYLSQIFSNLLGNAVKFVAAGVTPEVVIRFETTGDEVKISVCDNGIGIDAAHYDRIFQIFGRVYADKKFEGTGIGLSIVKKAVQRIGGTIGVESVLGKGTCFWFTVRKA